MTPRAWTLRELSRALFASLCAGVASFAWFQTLESLAFGAVFLPVLLLGCWQPKPAQGRLQEFYGILLGALAALLFMIAVESQAFYLTVLFKQGPAAGLQAAFAHYQALCLPRGTPLWVIAANLASGLALADAFLRMPPGDEFYRAHRFAAPAVVVAGLGALAYGLGDASQIRWQDRAFLLVLYVVLTPLVSFAVSWGALALILAGTLITDRLLGPEPAPEPSDPPEASDTPG